MMVSFHVMLIIYRSKGVFPPTVNTGGMNYQQPNGAYVYNAAAEDSCSDLSKKLPDP
jgi:hypothetical protein